MLLITDNTATLIETLSHLPGYIASTITTRALRDCVSFGDYESFQCVHDEDTLNALDIMLQRQVPAWGHDERLSEDNADWIVLIRKVGHLIEAVQFVRPADH